MPDTALRPIANLKGKTDENGNLYVTSSGGGGGAVTVADGADVAEGAVADAKVTGDNAGTISAKLRGLSYLLNLVIDIANTRVRTYIDNATLAVTQSGLWKWAGPAGTIWSAHHIPAANAQATITKASAGASTKNVCTGLTVALASSSTTAPAAVQLTVSLIDGATGGGTYLWRTVISLPAVAGAVSAFVLRGLWIPGSDATAMTLEFSAAGGANTIESVSMTGTTTT